ncbi:MAG: hypothetical protein KDK36_09115 [Leptospiraceae bacterium]|nr:hypothetical protein [Leptospiraceae bacterium]
MQKNKKTEDFQNSVNKKQKMQLFLFIPFIVLILTYCTNFEDNKKNNENNRNLALLGLLKEPYYDPDQAIIDAEDADIVNPGPLNLEVKELKLNSSSTVYPGKNFAFTVNIKSDYNAKNVLVRYIFIDKSQIDAGATTGLKQFEVLDRIPYINKGTNDYSVNIPIPDQGSSYNGAFTIYTIIDPENIRDNYFRKEGMLSGIKQSGNTSVTIDGSKSGTRDLFLTKLKPGSDVWTIKSNQDYRNTQIGVSVEAYSSGLDTSGAGLEFYFADTNGTKLTSLGKLLIYNSSSNSGSSSSSISLTKDQKKNVDVVLIPDSSTALSNIASYINTNGSSSLKIYAEINPARSISEIDAPGNASSNSLSASITTPVDTATKSFLAKSEEKNLNSSPLKEYSYKYGTGTLGDKSLLAADFNFTAYGKLLKNTTVVGHGEAESEIYLFNLINRKLFKAYAHAELIPIRMKDSYVDAEVQMLNPWGGMDVVFKRYESGARSFYWYTTKYKEKRIIKRIYPNGVPVRLTGVIAGILLSSNRDQLSECTINSCTPDRSKYEGSGFVQTNDRNYSVAQIHIRNNFEFNVNPRLLLRGFAQGKPDTGISMGVEGQLTILDVFPVAKATATTRMINNAYQVEIEFKETFDVAMEYLYGKIEFFLEIPYPSISFWNASIEYYKKYFTLVQWDSVGTYSKRFLDESQFLRIHLYTGQVDYTY